MPGFVADGFEPVRDFVEQSPLVRDGGAGFAAYVEGERVLDVYAGVARPGQPWQPDTLAVLMSVTKAFASMCLQILDDRGELDVEAKVAYYWPEFAAAGKADVTVRQILLHTAGAFAVPQSLRLAAADGEGWDDYDAISSALAAQPSAWPPGTRQGYHALTYGWLTGEIVRRITSMSIGAFFRQQVTEPLGLDLHVGAGDAELARVAPMTAFDNAELPFPMRRLMTSMERKMSSPTTPIGMAFGGNGTTSIMAEVVDLIAHGGILRAEAFSSSGLASADSLAKIFSILALDGEVDGKRILSKESVAKWSAPIATASDYAVTGSLPPWLVKVGRLERMTSGTRTLGYLYNAKPARGPRLMGPTPSALGGLGAGGQVGAADPARRVSFGFIRSALSHNPKFSNGTIQTFYDCLDQVR